MKGALPVPHIVAILIGLAVVGLLGYWFFVLSGKFGSEAGEKECMTRIYTACARWREAGFPDEPGNYGLTDSLCKQCYDVVKDPLYQGICLSNLMLKTDGLKEACLAILTVRG